MKILNEMGFFIKSDNSIGFKDKDEEDIFNLSYSKNKRDDISSFYSSKTKEGLIIYSISNMKLDNEKLSNLIKLKKEFLDEETYLNYIYKRLKLIIDHHKIDYIIQIPSNGVFLNKIVKSIKNKFHINDSLFLSIRKNKIQDLEIDYEKLENKTPKEIAKIEKLIKSALDQQIKKGKDYLEAKKFPKPYLKLLKNFFTIENMDEEFLKDKNILVIDDNYSTGTTIKDFMTTLSKRLNSKNIFGLTFFKLS